MQKERGDLLMILLLHDKIMKIKPRLPGLLFILFLWGCIFTAGTALAMDAKIFILHSYHQEYPWTLNQNNGFIQTLTSSTPADNISFSTEYLDTKRIKFNKEYQEFFFQYLRQKFVGYAPDVIFSSDDNALTFLLQFKDRLFGDAPVVFCGVNDFGVENNLNRQEYTGIFEKKDIAPNLDLLPAIKNPSGNIIFLGDDSSTHHAIEQTIREDIASKYPDHKYTLLSSNDLSSLINELRVYKEGVIFLTTIGEMKDGQGNVLPLQKTLKALVTAGNFTIFSMEDAYLAEGILGGFVTSGISQGKAAANQVIQILGGNSPAAIPLIMDSPNEFIFNYPQLQKIGLSVSQLPLNSIILNQPYSFYEQHKYKIWLFFVFLILQTLIIVFLIRNIHMRQEAEANILKAHAELEQKVIERTSELSETNRNLTNVIIERKHAEEEREKLIGELQKALKEIKTLRGIIPICSYCKSIRNDQGAWSRMEAYFLEHTQSEFSHGICPDCLEKQMKELDEEE